MRKKRKKQVNAPVGSATFERGWNGNAPDVRWTEKVKMPTVTVRLTNVKVKTLVTRRH